MTELANKEIRDAAKATGVRLWQVAHCMGVTDATFSRKLRFELPAEERDRILGIITSISPQKAQVG